MYILNFDICAIIIDITLVCALFLRKSTNGIQNKSFLAFVTALFLSALFSLLTGFSGNDPNLFPRYVAYMMHSMYLPIRNLTSLGFVLYIISVTDIWHIFFKKKALMVILILPMSLILLLIAFNPLYKLVFYINDDLNYVRGPLFFILYISAGYYILLGVIILIRQRFTLNPARVFAFFSLVALTVVAVIIQFFNPHYVVEMFCTSISALLLMLLVQRPEDAVDSYTGLNKRSKYLLDMKHSFHNHKEFDVIQVNINNYEQILSVIGYGEEPKLLGLLSNHFLQINNRFKNSASAYYLDRGRFRVVIGPRKRAYTEQIAEFISSLSRQNLYINLLEINTLPNICITHCPADISDYQDYVHFDNEMTALAKYPGKIYYASEFLTKDSLYLTNKLDLVIENALANHNFFVYYQPIYSVEKGRFTSAEALIRLIDKEAGFVSPDQFIPAAEKSGAIFRIGSFVFEEVCKFIVSDHFKELGLEFIEVNLSVVQCMQADLADTLTDIMNRYGVSPSQINLEITETAASYSQTALVDNMRVLTNRGIDFSLDDYGTGYSNISRIASLPLRIIKLDKTFVDHYENPRIATIVKNTVQMIKDLNLEIVVEGIETKEMLEHFVKLKCDYIQGYYFSKPLALNDFIGFIQSTMHTSFAESTIHTSFAADAPAP